MSRPTWTQAGFRAHQWEPLVSSDPVVGCFTYYWKCSRCKETLSHNPITNDGHNRGAKHEECAVPLSMGEALRVATGAARLKGVWAEEHYRTNPI